MNKKLLALPFFLLLTTLGAQNSTFSFWIESNIGVSDRLFVNDGSVPDAVVEIRSNLEKIRMGYDLGILVEYPLTGRWSLQSGLKYANWGYRTDKMTFNFAEPNSEFPGSQKTRTQNVYLEIPIRLNYHFALRRGQVFVWGAYSPSYNVSNTIKIRSYYPDEAVTDKIDDPEDDKYRTINMIGEFGVGWQVALSNKIAVRIGPNFRWQTLGQAQEAPLNRKLTFYGLLMGIQFK